MTHKNVYMALAAAQAQFSSPKKDAVNPAFRSKYADLASVVEAVAPALSANGIAFFHCVEDGAMVTKLVHGESETSVSCAVPLIVGKNDMQGFKSATTYAKRIGLESVTGVAPEDDDGNAAAKSKPFTRKTVPDAEMATEDGLVSSRKAEPYPPNATPAQKARIAADGIIKEMREAKTFEGLNGVWSRHEGIIERLQLSYPAEHGDVLDTFSACASRFEAA